MTSLQDAVTAPSAWAELCHGRFGHAKTSLLCIGKTTVSSTMQETLVKENKPIKTVKVHKHLGVMLTESLKWSIHIESVISGGIKKTGPLFFMAKDLPADLVGKLYVTYLRPVLEYASPVWHGVERGCGEEGYQHPMNSRWKKFRPVYLVAYSQYCG